MNRFRALSLFSLGSALALPLSVFAADLPLLTPGWSLVPEACRACPCGFAGVIGIVQNLMNAGISVGIFFAVIIMTWAGLLYISTPTNPEARSKANNMLINAVVGMVIILSAWLIVDFVMKALYSGPDGQQGKFGPWNNILTGGDTCVSSIETLPLFDGNITAEAVKQALTTGPSVRTGAGAGPGSCAVRTSGACAYQNFGTAFGSVEIAKQASQVCFGESSGNASNVSRSDIMKNDPKRRAFSFGLFQINITVHAIAGNDCPSAFKGKNYDAVVVNEALYAKCVAAAKTPETNTNYAVKLYKQSKGWGPWSAAKKCGLADAGHEPARLAFNRMIRSGVSLLP